MGVSTAGPGGTGRPPCGEARPQVVWHDLECGAYRADLRLWRELADAAAPEPGSEPILDVGAGTGRVALDLLRRGHRVIALDIDAELLGALAGRAGAGEIETVCADARTLDLRRSDLALVLVPMQTIQLLGGSAGRGAFLARARAHLRPEGLLACAIVTKLVLFDCAAGDLGPSVESTRVGGCLFESRDLSVRLDGETVVIERERRIRPQDTGALAPAAELNVIELDRLEVSQLQREGARAGLSLAGTAEVPASEDHVGSTVVMFRA
jgi:SAM-dependent methyltransferase